MTLRLTAFIVLLGLCGGPALAAEPAVRLVHMAARVTVIAERRADVSASVEPGTADLPSIRMRIEDGVLVADGGLDGRIEGCELSAPGAGGVRVRGLGTVTEDALPQVTVRTPMDVRLAADGALFGRIAPSAGLDLATAGCGRWAVADVAGRFDLTSSGSAEIAAGRAGGAAATLSGSGGLALASVRNELRLAVAGSGRARVGAVQGPIDARITGSGGVVVDAGHAAAVTVSVAGSGDFRFGGVADRLDAEVTGSGSVSLARVAGPVSQRVAGSGRIRIGD